MAASHISTRTAFALALSLAVVTTLARSSNFAVIAGQAKDDESSSRTTFMQQHKQYLEKPINLDDQTREARELLITPAFSASRIRSTDFERGRGEGVHAAVSNDPMLEARGRNRRGGAQDVVASPSGLSFTSTNLYPAITWSPWTALAEPYKEAVLRADSALGGDADKDVFMWTLPEENGAAYEGR